MVDISTSDPTSSLGILSTVYRFFVPNQTPLPPSPHLHTIFQSLYSFDNNSSMWRPMKLSANTPIVQETKVAILTWNIDFSAPLPILRFQALLAHLEQLLSPLSNPDAPPTIILLQEFHQSCFPTLLSNPFICAVYTTSDATSLSWDKNSSYGTITLVPKSLSGNVASVFRTSFTTSEMGRDALYIDLNWLLLPPTPTSLPTKKRIRIANTHLESLPGHGDRARPVQLQSISQFLSCHGISGGLVGGDMNAISPSDATIADTVGLTDAWLALLEEDENLGHTWGYQPPTVFPPGRLDKFLSHGCLKVERIERIGVGLKGGEEWVSDHYALLATAMVD